MTISRTGLIATSHIIFGDMGKAERDESNEYNNYQPGSLNTIDQLIKDLDNIDIVFHIGDITYANGYISQWDQFTSQVEPIASRVPYMIASGNHERDVPGTDQGISGEPMGRDSLQKLWQKYKVDIAFYGHIHKYERTCPVHQSQCVNSEKHHYPGMVNGTIHVVAGGGGSHLSGFGPVETSWSIFRDSDFGFVKLTAYNHSDVLACVHDGCEPITLAT
ncbi:hypothetical protein K1719_038526 [Acacia pycnantha]|nr:hypothetical protein K1719_038526 [Acacia pycnantha]